jgi:hypothetical protein
VQQPAEPGAGEAERVLDQGVAVEDEHASLAGASAGGEDDVLAEQLGRFGRGGGQVRLDQAARQPGIGDHLVEGRHHLGLGHDGEGGQVVQADAVRVDLGQALGVEG